MNYKSIFIGGLILGTGLGLSSSYYEDTEDYRTIIKDGEIVKKYTNKFRDRLLRKSYNIFIQNGLSCALAISGYILTIDTVINNYTSCSHVVKCYIC